MVSYNDSFDSNGNYQQPAMNQKHQFLSVQKPPSKPSKKPPSSAAPPSSSSTSSTKPRVYNVKPIHFRELVQRLTGAASQPQPPTQQIQSAPPPPIQLISNPNNAWLPPSEAYSSNNLSLNMPQDQKKSMATYSDGFMVGDGTELSLSPSSCSWFSFPLLSPGPLSNFGA